MLGDVKTACGIEIEPLAVADTGGIALLGREDLAGLVGVVAPDSGRIKCVDDSFHD